MKNCDDEDDDGVSSIFISQSSKKQTKPVIFEENRIRFSSYGTPPLWFFFIFFIGRRGGVSLEIKLK